MVCAVKGAGTLAIMLTLGPIAGYHNKCLTRPGVVALSTSTHVWFLCEKF